MGEKDDDALLMKFSNHFRQLFFEKVLVEQVCKMCKARFYTFWF